ncbi:signal peptidase I [Pseudarthrobacter niigatensis]|uniref:Signal peptidase I n=1 Tax=Pseudarthrobacter niigatensis TaxID=369935 RepID=A0AAJ1SSE9_9MICC|nr:signal peptidase I [Pseudarthrobacter niigatensis]MDQ0145906.1 signal peptidase [Pseudarthrobacter niigatensis]MDQ0266366.1 signal peptidase [Pseudarthrobacter niigatensis]
MAADLTERPLGGVAGPWKRWTGTAQATPKSGRRSKAAWTAVGRFLSMAAMLVALFAALVLIVVPVATGSQTYTILTKSMVQKYPPGTFMVMKPAPFDELKYGDVVTFQLYSGRPDVETHRIVGFGSTQQGEKTLITKGDNNGANDPEPVRAIQVKGKLFYAVPYVGFVANFLGNSDRGTWTVIAAVALIGYGAITVYTSVRKTRKRDEPAAEAA